MVDFAPFIGAMTATAGLGAVGAGMHATVHGLGGANFVSKNAHLHGQMQAGTVMARDFANKVGDQSILADVQSLTRQAADAERRQMRVISDPRYLRYNQTYSHVPQEWMDAFQARRAYGRGHTPAPAGRVSGKNFLDFENETLGLWDRANSRYNAGLKKHGQDGISPEMGPLHPSSVSSWGTDNFFKRYGSEFVSGVKNAYRELRGGEAKGFAERHREQLRSDYGETLHNEVRTDGDSYCVPVSQRMPHFETHLTGGEAPSVKKVGGRYVMLNRDGSPVRTRAQAETWMNEESSRFVRNMDVFKNTSGDKGILSSNDAYKRKLPFLKTAHQATFQDLTSEIIGMDTKAAALEGHDPDVLKKVDELRTKISKAGDKSGAIDKDALRLNSFLGGGANAHGANTLIGRLAQQQGRLAGGSAWAPIKAIAALNPFAYRQALSVSQNPVAAQQWQALMMNLAFSNQDPALMGRLGRDYARIWGKNLEQSATGEPGNLGIPHNKMRFDRLGVESFEKSNAMWNAAIEKDIEKRVGGALTTGDDAWLDMMYTPEQKSYLRRRLREDGSVDLSDEEAKLLANSVLGRHLEGVNGMDLPTSKPAAFHSEAVKPFTMFMSTPAVVAKSVVDLYRPGGMLHTGNFKLDTQGKALVSAALAAQFASSSAVRSSALAKAISIFSAGGWLPGITQGLAAAQEYDSQSEVANKQQQELLQAATMRLVNGESNPEDWATDVIKLAGVGVTGAVPMKVIGSGDVIGSMAGKIDERALGFPGDVRQKPGLEGTIKEASKVIPALGPWVNLGLGVRDYLSPDRKYLNGRLAALFTRGESPIPYFNQISPMVPGIKAYMDKAAPVAPEYGEVKTKRISPKVGR